MTENKCGVIPEFMRQEFEAWYAPLFAGGFVANMYVPLFAEGFVPNMPVRENGEYVSSQQQIAWMSWKAAKSVNIPEQFLHLFAQATHHLKSHAAEYGHPGQPDLIAEMEAMLSAHGKGGGSVPPTQVVAPLQFILEPVNPCTHIVGRAWQLNPEEGAAWINRYVEGTGPFPDPNDWNYAFTHCPVCGEALVPPEGVDVITMEDAKWSKAAHEDAQGVGQ